MKKRSNKQIIDDFCELVNRDGIVVRGLFNKHGGFAVVFDHTILTLKPREGDIATQQLVDKKGTDFLFRSIDELGLDDYFLKIILHKQKQDLFKRFFPYLEEVKLIGDFLYISEKYIYFLYRFDTTEVAQIRLFLHGLGLTLGMEIDNWPQKRAAYLEKQANQIGK